MKIFFSESALSDLEKIREYYLEEGVPHIGEEFIKSIIQHTETLLDNPEMGRIVPEFQEKKIRELIHPPFRIVYLREKNSCHILRIWRSERLLKLKK
jgi:plasmid stabilization system protein ParE